MQPSETPDNSVIVLYQQASRHIAQQQYEEAITTCQNILQLQPNFALAYSTIGLAKQLQGQLEEAKSYYENALKLQPNWVEVLGNLGTVYLQQQQWEKALKFYEIALQLKPNQVGIYRNLYSVFSYLNQPEKALECWFQVLILEPESIPLQSHIDFGKSLISQSKWDQAISLYLKTLEIYPNSHQAYYWLGEAFSGKQQWLEAIKAYRQAIKIENNIDWFYPKLGKALLETHQWYEAVIAYYEAAKSNAYYQELLDEIIPKIIQSQELIQASLIFEEQLKKRPEADELYHILGNIYKVNNKIVDAIFYYTKAIQINPNLSQYYADLGDVWLKQKQWEQAIYCCLEALKINPDFMKPYDIIAEVLMQQGYDEEGLGCYNAREIPSAILQKYCPIPTHQLTLSQIDSQINFIPIYSESNITLTPSKTISQSQFCLMFDHATTQKAFVAILENARAWGDLATSAIITENNQLVTDLSTGCAELVLSSNQLAPVYQIEGTIAFLSVRWGATYFHWLYDVLPGFHLIQESGISWDDIDYFVINADYPTYQKETLVKLGVPLSKIIVSMTHHHIQAHKIIVPSPNLMYKNVITPAWVCNFLRSAFLPANIGNITPYRRIYLSREKASYRNVINQDELFQCLKPLNFESVVLETLSFSEQVELMATASVVIAPHGAGLSNIVFCQPRTKIIELFHPDYVPIYYRLISNLCQLEHYYLISEVIDKTTENLTHLGQLDMKINLDEFMKLLELAEIKIT
ncbi:UDP-N-acetylglucosamine--peptide N-acetylglucosaminyltransferase [Planktothrix tepida]|uniref:Putative Tetratricopeptide TPR repeat protein n=1 Tax=Planktothrix tepida PCC 9214 TaxID=671072 RepID=A0A1J1LQW6_9CYAN|nr:tetratricopeptide repeat protein [Planktothrix tepida]CAD5962454.1 UDP-N-acetylglucosamine--peptide N-acetylglucosaminyltransferase [Planktothrix tepida]CUR34823.1 putative Tetratricopeptide TPR repeat protein [Planktothrix tepida PCC 9214]